MASVTTQQAVSSFVGFLLNGTVTSGDAANSVASALDEKQKDPLVRYLAAISATASLTGIAGSSTQMLQQFKEDSPAAGSLMGRFASVAAKVGLVASVGSVVNTAYKKGIGEVNISQLTTVVAAALSVRAFAVTPMGAIGLGVASGILTVAGWVISPNAKLSDFFDFLKGPIHSYYDQLSPDEQASFTATFSATIESCFNGCIPVPQIDDAGWVNDWQVMMPTDASGAGQSGEKIIFANGVQYIYGAPASDTPLQVTDAVQNQDVWKFQNPTKTGLDVFVDGSFANVFTNDQIGAASEIWITGTGTNYTVASDSKPAVAAPTHFIYINGTGNTVTTACDNNFIYVANGNNVIAQGAQDYIYVEKSATVIFETDDPSLLAGSRVMNQTNGETWTIGDDGIVHSSASDSSAFVINPGRNIFWFDGNGSSNVATQSEDGRVYHYRYDANGLMEEQLVILPSGSYTQILYNFPGGYVGPYQMLTSSATGTSGSLWKFNEAGQNTEYINYTSAGIAYDFVGGNLVGTSSFPPLPAVHLDLATGVVTWSPR